MVSCVGCVVSLSLCPSLRPYTVVDDSVHLFYLLPMYSLQMLFVLFSVHHLWTSVVDAFVHLLYLLLMYSLQMSVTR